MAECEQAAPGRRVYLPLSKIDKCNLCQKTSRDAKLRLCTACAEALYCSAECQQKDWKRHKAQCGKTDRIDLQSFYPFLACIAQACHIYPDIVMTHPALNHQIVNSPNPCNGDPPVQLPNGVGTKLLLLGEKIPFESPRQRWWPTGASDKVRHKLLRRIVSEGLLMPISLCICIALVSEMYTTTALQPEEQEVWQMGRRRVRLTYNNSPIADFGIAQGSVRVTPGDRLAYWNIYNDEFLMGQDPTGHYRIYIKTLAGGEYYLDFGMFTFNFCFMVNVEPYCRFGLPDLKMVPAHFNGKEYDKTGIDALLFKPRKRFSVLRDTRIHQLVLSTKVEYCECHDQPNIFSVMDEISGRKSTDWEKYAMMTFLPNAVKLMQLNMRNREYVNFPKVPNVIIDVDPNEEGITDDENKEGEEMAKFLTKWTRKLRKGKITQERWEADFQKWASKPHEARMRRVNSK